MSFFIYDISFLIIFSIFVAIFLYSRRKKLEREGILYLYRTKVGIKIINYIGKKYAGVLRVLEYLVIITGYILMTGMIYILVKSITIFLNPAYVKAIKIPPLAPLIPYLPEIFNVSFLPPFYFTYWILAIAIVAIFHEFSHGIFARLHNVKIKSTGFGFLGPFLAAFVEPDENKIKRLNIKNQLSILSAGTFANVILTIIFFLLMWGFFASAYTASGAVFDTYTYSIVNKSSVTGIGSSIHVNFDGGLNLTEIYINDKTYFVETSKTENLSDIFIAYDDTPALRTGLSGMIVKINDEKVKTYSDLGVILGRYGPGDRIMMTTLQNNSERDYEITLGENPSNESRAYVGVAIYSEKPSIFGKVRSFLTFFKQPGTYYAPKENPEFIIFIYNLLWWIVLINFSVALVNMLPVGIFDGGRVFYLTMLKISNEKIAKILYKISTFIILGIFVLLMVLWGFGFFGK